MKGLILVLILFISSDLSFGNNHFSFFYSKSLSPGDTNDIIVGINVSDNVSVQNIRTKLVSVTNLTVMCFCKNLGVFIVRGVGPDYGSKSEVFQACQKSMNGGYDLFLKTGTNKEILSQCNSSIDDDPAKIKELLR
ncbi:MAG: hypothetical protein H0U95_00820 [Bacteroidetes bacterium]|nr:hypothetical protein [Bacteroidota bacterium]